MRRYDKPAIPGIGTSGGSTQVFVRGKRWSMSQLTLNVASSSAGTQTITLRDGGTAGTVKWRGGILATTVGNTFHATFPGGAKFEDGIAANTGGGIEVYITAIDVSEGI